MSALRIPVADPADLLVAHPRRGWTPAHMTAATVISCDAIEIVATTTGDEVVIVVAGTVDAFTSAPLRMTFREACAIAPRIVVVDAAEVGFVDAAGVGVLLDARRRLAAAGVAFTVRSASPPLQRVVELLDVTDLVESASKAGLHEVVGLGARL